MNEYLFERIKVGDREGFSVKITEDMEKRFREITGDFNPLHSDDAFAREAWGGKFRQHVTFGMLTASFYSTFAGVYMPGKYSLIHSIEDIKFKQPVYAGDTLTVSGVVEEKQEGLKLIAVKVKITNQDGGQVSSARMKIIVMK